MNRKEIPPELFPSILKQIRESFLTHPPTGEKRQNNLQRAWDLAQAAYQKEAASYEKAITQHIRYRSRGLTNLLGGLDSQFLPLAEDYRQRLRDKTHTLFRQEVQAFDEEPDYQDSFYWTSVSQPRASLAELPAPPSHAMSPKIAEHFVGQFLLYMGAVEAETTSFTKDGGVDVLSRDFVCQVKHQASKVGVATVRETIAVAMLASRQPMIFSKTGFSSGALELAIMNDVLLFTYLPSLVGETDLSSIALAKGFHQKLQSEKASLRVLERNRRKQK